MSTNKNAVLRYNTLDKCFSNFGRKYYLNDLLDAVNEALEEEDSATSGIRIRQLREDIRFMKSETGYAAPIMTHMDGKKAFYRYEDKAFSINNRPLNATEAAQLKRAISILHRFEGAPEFEWINEIAPMLSDKFGLIEADRKVMAYESNIDYSGYQFLTPLFNAILNKRVLKIRYAPFTREGFELCFHPYFLKQYNNRWFVLGYNEGNDMPTWNLALDRIVSQDETDHKYRPDDTDWDDYFYDIIGVSRNDAELIEVELIFNPSQAPYIQTKPLHGSQKSVLLEDGSLSVRIKVIPNTELEMKLLSFGETVKIITPDSLKDVMKTRLLQASNQY